MSMRTYQHNKQAHRRARRLARAESRVQAPKGVNDNNLFAQVA